MQNLTLNTWQKFVLVLIRFVIGWHMYYQGWGKLWAVNWSAKWYLEAAKGPFASWFQWLAESPTLLAVSDIAVVWGLMILGLLLMLGLFTRVAALAGIALMLLFFLAAPPLPVMGFSVATAQGSELYVDKTFIEVLALVVVLSFPTGQMAGLDVLVRQYLRRRKQARFMA